MKTQTQRTCIRLSHDRKSSYPLFGSFTALTALLTLFGGQPNVNAQSDNFDAAPPLNAAWTKEEFFPQGYSFVTSGSGKALRIQANPIPGAAPAAAAIFQATVYTDFYVAVDVVNWAVKDQAIVLLGHWTMAGLAGDSGMILNYDAAQDGDTATKRRGGQLQMNTVGPGFATTTFAAADITFEPGHSYRLVFQAVGSLYTGEAYDLNDLTKPLVKFTANDGGAYPSGHCGFLSFSRDGTTGTTDVTIDNYYAAVSDPNTAIAPAIHHSLFTDSGTGVPQVVTRTPAKRFSNFLSPAIGSISFNVQTFTADLIKNSGTKLYLNNTLFATPGAGITTSADAATIAYTTTIPLVANTVYSARIEVESVPGLKSTNTFWFDTFSDAYLLTSPVKTVEVEDYNYTDFVGTGNKGLWHNPILVSGLDSLGFSINPQLAGGYFDPSGSATATDGVDYHRNPGGSWHIEYSEYRTGDKVQITQGSYTVGARDEAGDIVDFLGNLPPQRINDTQRSQYLAAGSGGVLEYQVRITSPGDWFNYTRIFPNQNYHVYLRCGSFDSTKAELELVGGNPATTSQTTMPLGTFAIPNHLQRLNYTYEPLTAAGVPAVVDLAGTQTIRLTMGGTVSQDDRLVSMDYLLFVPTSDPCTVLLASSSTVNGTYTEAVGASVNTVTKTITVPISGSTQFYRVVTCNPATSISNVQYNVPAGFVTITYTP